MTGAPYLTRDLPGIGGRLRARPDHFVVEEIPLREPLGSGAFLRVLIEKRRMSTPELLRRLSRELGLKRGEAHVAGNKDSDAVTRQWVSLPARVESRLRRLELEGAVVLAGDLDPEPLATGDLLGNRFSIVVSELERPETAGRAAEEILAVLVERGVPHYFGPQRFGTRLIAADIGGALLRGESERAIELLLSGAPDVERDPNARRFRELCAAERWDDAYEAAPPGLGLERGLIAALLSGVERAHLWKRIPHADRRLFLSAWQSRIFNRIVGARLDSIDRPIRGDILVDHANGDRRVVHDPEAELDAVRTFAASPTGWMPGAEAERATDEAGAIESACFETDAVPARRFFRPLDLTLPGERRPLRVPLLEPEVAVSTRDRAIRLEFDLPRGAFATAVLAEVRKCEPAPA